MILPWVVAAVALTMSVLALVRARRTAQRLDQLVQMYWELKYQQGELRTRFQQLTGETPQSPREPRPSSGDGFVPLTSLRR
jgi:hypothetical protein